MTMIKELLAALPVLLDGLPKPGDATTEPEGTISARVWRANTGRWEDLGIIATARKGTI